MGLPATMRAAVCRGRGRVAIEERALPELGPRDVLLLHELAAGRIAGKLMVAPG